MPPEPTSLENCQQPNPIALISDPLLEIKNLSAGYGSCVVLKDMNFSAPDRGLMVLMGPSGTGKSTLLRSIARWNDAQPAFWARGQILLNGENLLHAKPLERVHHQIPMLVQKARLYTASVLENAIVGTVDHIPSSKAELEQLAYQVFQPLGLWEEFQPLLPVPVLDLSMAAHKKILIARLLARGASCLLADEPLRDIAIVEEAGLIDLLRGIAKRMLTIVITHNKIEAQQLSDMVCFVSGDQVVEVTPSEEFFERPRTELGREFLRTGSSWPKAQWDTDEEELSDQPVQASKPLTTPPRQPREFHWVIMNRLGGMQKPGLLNDTEEDLEGLRNLGVKVLVSLTEDPFDITKLHAYGIQAAHYPIIDMSVPSLQEAESMCRYISELLDADHPTVLHCKAGLGRTGTILACVLVYRSMDPMRAIEAVRTVKPGYIQTEEQLDFVGEFSAYLSHEGTEKLTINL